MGVKISFPLTIFMVGLLLVACSTNVEEDVPIPARLLDTATIINTPLASKILPSHTPSVTPLPIDPPTLTPQLTTTPSPESALKLEPTMEIFDPNQIVYTSAGELFLFDLWKYSKTLIDTGMDTIYGSRMSFSPDGTRLLYFNFKIGDNEYGTPQGRLLNLITNEQYTLPLAINYSWSPRSDLLFFHYTGQNQNVSRLYNAFDASLILEFEGSPVRLVMGEKTGYYAAGYFMESYAINCLELRSSQRSGVLCLKPQIGDRIIDPYSLSLSPNGESLAFLGKTNASLPRVPTKIFSLFGWKMVRL